MTNFVSPPAVGYVPVVALTADDEPPGRVWGLVVPDGLCLILTDADVYCPGVLLPSDGVFLTIGVPSDPSQNVFYSHLDDIGTGHWSGFQKISGGLALGAYCPGGTNFSVAASGYLTTDYTWGDGY